MPWLHFGYTNSLLIPATWLGIEICRLHLTPRLHFGYTNLVAYSSNLIRKWNWQKATQSTIIYIFYVAVLATLRPHAGYNLATWNVNSFFYTFQVVDYYVYKNKRPLGDYYFKSLLFILKDERQVKMSRSGRRPLTILFLTIGLGAPRHPLMSYLLTPCQSRV